MIALVLVILCIADDQGSYDTQALHLRLRRLEEENTALQQETRRLSLLQPNCTAFYQTGGCDPDGPVERQLPCSESVPTGSSGFCECRGGDRTLRVTCDHAPFQCDRACSDHQQTAHRVGVQSHGQQVVLRDTAAPAGACPSIRGCLACAAVDGCAWCLQTRRCVSDDPWICQGDVDHVSHPDGIAIAGRPGKARCPSPAEMEQQRAARQEREKAAANAHGAGHQRPRPVEAAGAASAGVGGGERTSLDDARSHVREREVLAFLEEERRLRDDPSGSEPGLMGDSAQMMDGPPNGEPRRGAAAAAPESDEQRKGDGGAASAAQGEELRRRAALAEEGEGGASRPYETLELLPNCSTSQIRKAYKRLAVRFHPDKNPGAHAELAHVAFQEVVAGARSWRASAPIPAARDAHQQQHAPPPPCAACVVTAIAPPLACSVRHPGHAR